MERGYITCVGECVAKQEMKEKSDGDLGSRAVTTADGTWQTRGWHSSSYVLCISARHLNVAGLVNPKILSYFEVYP